MEWNDASANGIAHISWTYNTDIPTATMPQEGMEVDVYCLVVVTN